MFLSYVILLTSNTEYFNKWFFCISTNHFSVLGCRFTMDVFSSLSDKTTPSVAITYLFPLVCTILFFTALQTRKTRWMTNSSYLIDAIVYTPMSIPVRNLYPAFFQIFFKSDVSDGVLFHLAKYVRPTPFTQFTWIFIRLSSLPFNCCVTLNNTDFAKFWSTCRNFPTPGAD